MLGLRLSRTTTLTWVSVVVVVIACLALSWYLTERHSDDPLSYVPSTASVAVVLQPRAIALESLAPELRQLLLQWGQSLPQFDDISTIVWSFSESTSQEQLTIIYRHDVPKALRTDGIVSLPLQSHQERAHWLSRRVVVWGQTTSNSQASWLTGQTIDQPLTILWYQQLPATITAQLSLPPQFQALLDSSARVKKLSASSWRSGWRLTWTDETETIASTTPETLYIPGDFSLLALLDAHESDSASWWQSLVEDSVRDISDSSTSAILKQLQAPMLLGTNGSQWFIRSSSAQLATLGQTIASFQQPLIKKLTLSDGSAYRELVRSQQAPLHQQLAGHDVSYWGQVAENRIYYWSQAGQNILTNDLKLAQGTNQAPENPSGMLTDCLGGASGTITNLIWLTDDSIIPLKLADKQQLLLLEVRTAGRSTKIACLGQK